MVRSLTETVYTQDLVDALYGLKSFADARYSDAISPHVLCVNGLPNPRIPGPLGGKRAAATIDLA